jgi:diaminopimelate epimerase
VNDSIHIEELAKKLESDKMEFIYDANFALVAVVPPEAEKAATPEAAAGATPAAAGAAPAAGAAAAASGATAPAAGAPAAKK